MNIAKRNQRTARMAAWFFVALIIMLLALSSSVDVGAIKDNGDIQIPMAYGDTAHLLCSEVPFSDQAVNDGYFTIELSQQNAINVTCNFPPEKSE